MKHFNNTEADAEMAYYLAFGYDLNLFLQSVSIVNKQLHLYNPNKSRHWSHSWMVFLNYSFHE